MIERAFSNAGKIVFAHHRVANPPPECVGRRRACGSSGLSFFGFGFDAFRSFAHRIEERSAAIL